MDSKLKLSLTFVAAVIGVGLIFLAIFYGTKFFVNAEVLLVVGILATYFYALPITNSAVYTYYNDCIDGFDRDENPIDHVTLTGALNRFLPIWNETRIIGKYSRTVAFIGLIISAIFFILLFIPVKVYAIVLPPHVAIAVLSFCAWASIGGIILYFISTGCGYIKLKKDIQMERAKVAQYLRYVSSDSHNKVSGFVNKLDTYAPFIVILAALLPVVRMLTLFSIGSSINWLESIGMTSKDVDEQMEELGLE